MNDLESQDAHSAVTAAQDRGSRQPERLKKGGLTFSLLIPPECRICQPNNQGCGQVVVTLENNRPHPARGRLEVAPLSGADASWFTVEGPRCRDFRGHEIQQVQVTLAIPPAAAGGKFSFRVTGVNEANPEDDYAESESIDFTWSPRRARFERLGLWLLAVGLPLSLLAAAAVVWYVLSTREINPNDTRETANRAAEKGDWEGFYNCWTNEGKAKWVLIVANWVRKASSADPKRFPQLHAWEEDYEISFNDRGLIPDFGPDTSSETAEDLAAPLFRRIRGEEGSDETDAQFFSELVTIYRDGSWLEDRWLSQSQASNSTPRTQAEFRKKRESGNDREFNDQIAQLTVEFAKQFCIRDWNGKFKAQDNHQVTDFRVRTYGGNWTPSGN